MAPHSYSGNETGIEASDLLSVQSLNQDQKFRLLEDLCADLHLIKLSDFVLEKSMEHPRKIRAGILTRAERLNLMPGDEISEEHPPTICDEGEGLHLDDTRPLWEQLRLLPRPAPATDKRILDADLRKLIREIKEQDKPNEQTTIGKLPSLNTQASIAKLDALCKKAVIGWVDCPGLDIGRFHNDLVKCKMGSSIAYMYWIQHPYLIIEFDQQTEARALLKKLSFVHKWHPCFFPELHC